MPDCGWRVAFQHVSSCFPMVQQQQVRAAETHAKRLLLNAVAFEVQQQSSEDLQRAPPPAATATVVEEEVIDSGVLSPGLLRIRSALKRKQPEPLAPLSPLEQAKEEIDEFLEMRDFGSAVDVKSDPLQFWQQKASRWPTLAKVAARFLMIPSSSAEVERIASTAGRVMTMRRAAMKPTNGEQLIYLAHNWQYVTSVVKK